MKQKKFATILFSCLLSSALVTVLIIRLFWSDRTANVFDSSRVVSSTLAGQVQVELANWSTELKLIAQDTDLRTNTVGSIGKYLLKESARINALWIYRMSDRGDYARGAAIVKDNLSALNVGYLETQFASLLKAARFNRMALSVIDLASDEKYTCQLAAWCRPVILMAVLSGDPYVNNHHIQVAMIQADQLIKIFSDSQTHRTYLLDAAGRSLLGPTPIAAGLSLDFSTWPFFKKAKLSRLAEGAEETKSSENVPMLVSYSQIDISNLMVVSVVKKSIALRGIQTLLIKAVLLYLIVGALSAIVALLVAKQLNREPALSV